jgi:predicted RNase H-like HicB family nuclease
MSGFSTTLTVSAKWDAESQMWTATSEDLPGLVTESETFEGLISRVSAVLPDLLSHSTHEVPKGRIGGAAAASRVRVIFHADRQVVVPA